MKMLKRSLLAQDMDEETTAALKRGREEGLGNFRAVSFDYETLFAPHQRQIFPTRERVLYRQPTGPNP